MDLLKALRYTDNPPGAKGRYRILALGKQGSGKTHFAATAPHPVFLDFDRGLKTLERQGIHVPAVIFEKDKGVYANVREILMKFATRDFTKEELAAYPELATMETLVIDGLSSLGNYLKSAAMIKGGKDPANEKASYDEWGILLANFLDIIGYTKDFPERFGLNVVVTALPQVRETEENDKEFAIIPLIEGSYKSYVGADFDEVYLLEAKPAGNRKVEYTMHTGPYLKFPGKSREFGNTDLQLENTWAAFEAAIQKRRAS